MYVDAEESWCIYCPFQVSVLQTKAHTTPLSRPPLHPHREARLHPSAVQVRTVLQVLIAPSKHQLQQQPLSPQSKLHAIMHSLLPYRPMQNKFSFCSRIPLSSCSFKYRYINFKRDCCCTCSSTCAESSPHC